MLPVYVAWLLAWTAHEVAPPAPTETRNVVTIYGVLAAIVIVSQIYGTTPLLDKEVERFSSLTRTGLYLPPMAFVVFVIVQGWRGPAVEGVSDAGQGGVSS